MNLIQHSKNQNIQKSLHTGSETIGVTYYCNSYFLNCGGGNFGGWGGVNFGAGAGSGSRGSSGEGGGGGSSKSTSDKEETEDEKKKKAEQRDKEYKDVRDRSRNTPKQQPGESKEAYNKRLSKYFEKLANDYQKWDDKWQPGRHTIKIKEIKARANGYRKAYEKAVKHREVKNQYQNQREKEKSQCKGSGRGVAKVITGIVCRIK